MDEKVFMARCVELVNQAKHQREGVAVKLVDEFNLSGKHSATRIVERLFGAKLSAMLKLRFEFPDTWLSKVPKAGLLETTDLYTRVLDLRKQGLTFKQAKEVLMQEFMVTETELVKRVRSLFQKPMADIFEPTDQEIQHALLRAENSAEFKELLGIASDNYSGFFGRRLGVSTFAEAKSKCLYKVKIPNLNPTTADNESIIFSQVLGDGSYDKVRKSIRISHSIKQLEYLRWKVSLISAGYPQLNSVENIKCMVHTQGHEYCSWYSTKLPEHIYSKLDTYSQADMLKELTPIGVLLLFLDDGCLYWKDSKVLSICQGNTLEVHQNLANYFSTYNIHGNVAATGFNINRQVEIVKFINTFIKPFSNIIPECMRYKTEIMI